MPSLPITPPTPARPGSAPKSASPPPESDPPTRFAALLSETSARTAPAEGPKTSPEQQPEALDLQVAADSPQPDQALAEADPAPTTPVVVVDPPVAAVVVAVPATPAPVPDASNATSSVPSAPATTQPPAALAVVAPAGPAHGGDAPVADQATPVADGAPGGKLQLPAELLGAKGGETKDFKNGDQAQRELPPAPTLPPTADAAATPTPATATAAPAPDAGASAPVPTTPAVAQAQPAATPQTAVAVAPGTPHLTRASVLQTVERVQELVRIATTRAGNARATLQLRPAELGQVDVHLRTTRNGLVATIAAHEQVGLDALQQAGNELRRSLEDKGVQLHSLDLQLGAGQNGFTNQGDAREASSGRRGAAASHGLDSDDTVAEDTTLTITAPSTPAGALVDVQA